MVVNFHKSYSWPQKFQLNVGIIFLPRYKFVARHIRCVVLSKSDLSSSCKFGCEMCQWKNVQGRLYCLLSICLQFLSNMSICYLSCSVRCIFCAQIDNPIIWFIAHVILEFSQRRSYNLQLSYKPYTFQQPQYRTKVKESRRQSYVWTSKHGNISVMWRRNSERLRPTHLAASTKRL